MTTIELLRWNVKGISNKTKRYKIITHLKSLESDVAMLQETHLKNTEAVKLRQRWVGQVSQVNRSLHQLVHSQLTNVLKTNNLESSFKSFF